MRSPDSKSGVGCWCRYLKRLERCGRSGALLFPTPTTNTGYFFKSGVALLFPTPTPTPTTDAALPAPTTNTR
jgi:hypothetical protein